MLFSCSEHEYAFYKSEKEECRKCTMINTPMNSECFKLLPVIGHCMCGECYWERERIADEALLRKQFNCSWCGGDERDDSHNSRSCGEEEDEAVERAHQRELERWNSDDMR